MKRTWIAFAVACLFTLPAFAGVKEDQHQQMSVLAQQMRDLKSQGQGGSALYAQLRAQYQQISAAMGGDEPAAAPTAGQPAVDGRGEAPQGNIGIIPPAPAGCAVTTTAFTQNTPTPIPTGPAVVSSTLVVAGAGPSVWDLNLQTFITHTFSADLDITLMSPAGTIVTLTTDNGGGNDNNYNGTAWDDDANPLGQVPYTTNDGLVTDALYANLVVETPLVPEDALAAFMGEDPNGTWTVTISDDLAGDGGSLASWTLEISTLPAPPIVATTLTTQATPTPIPTGPAVVSSTVVVAGAGTSIVDVDLIATITHTFAADLDMTIMSPAGTIATITTDNGGGNDNVWNGTTWNDDADPDGQVPYTTNDGLVTDALYANLVTETPQVIEEALAAFVGEDPNGTWTFTISDDLAGDGGSLATWSLDIDTGTCVQPCVLTCPANVTQSNDPDQCGAVTNYPAPTTTGTCGAITCSPPSGSFFPVGTTTITCQDNPPPFGGTGGPATCAFTVTINDTQPPTMLAPDLVVPTDPGVCTGTATPVGVTSDNCPGETQACVPPGPTFPQGVNPITCTATDASGNTATDGGSVTVNDLEPPVLTCPADIVEDLPPGVPSGPVTWSDPLVADNCPNPGAPTCVPPSGSIFTGGTTTPVNCSATDASGNPGTCSFNVTLNLVSILEIPTASTWGLAALALLLAGAAFVAFRRKA